VLYTIGYEGRTLDEFLAELASVHVERVIDVREAHARSPPTHSPICGMTCGSLAK
jgi:uncharacterized protein (DUF488 family)